MEKKEKKKRKTAVEKQELIDQGRNAVDRGI